MSPHDLELKRYNDITNRLEQIELQLHILQEYNTYSTFSNIVEDCVKIAGENLLDVKDLFRKYAERQHD